MSSTQKNATRKPPEKRGERLESLERGLRVLELFGQGSARNFAMIEIADQLRITRASTLRILATLEAIGYVRLDGRTYSLTPRVLALGYSYLASLGFRTVARPILEDMVRHTRETCSIGVLDGTDVVYVAREESRRLIRIDLSVGSRLPAHLNSMGRVLLAALPDADLNLYIKMIKLEKLTKRSIVDRRELKLRILETRALGYCYIDGEVDDRIAGLATPVRNRNGATIAALNLSLGFGRHDRAQAEEIFLPLLRKASQQIESIVQNDISVN
ncbi:MAG: helix-turn-helix domain-containing protein [Rhodoferax sp.]|nr:helix-turn-helix domain-containing protein [Rhodoferax sp.]